MSEMYKKLWEKIESIAMEFFHENNCVVIPNEKLNDLEKNELFAEATKEGLSDDVVRKILEPALDYFLENIDKEKVKNSATVKLLNSVGVIRDFTTATGATLFEYLKSSGLTEEYYTPEFKKKLIIEKAVILTLESSRISFNTAVKRTIATVQSDEFVSLEIELMKKEVLEVAKKINEFVDIYLEYEDEIYPIILKAILKVAIEKYEI